MTITNRIKSELFNAEMEYYDALDAHKARFPHGTSFLGATVSTEAAILSMRLCTAEAKYSALSALVKPIRDGALTEAETRRLIDKWNNAETSDEAIAAEAEYYCLYSIRR